LQNISISVEFSEEILSDLQKHNSILNHIVDDNNKKINGINTKKNKIGEENKSVRKELCQCAYNNLIDIHATNT